MTLLRVEPDALRPWQAMYASNGIQAVSASVPPRPLVEGEVLKQFYVLDVDEVPVGLLSEINMGEGVVEVGVRFWEQKPSLAFLLDKWMRQLLSTYSAVVIRCYANNHPVKKLVQRAGFRLFRLERVMGRQVEFYMVTPGTYMGREQVRRDG